MAGTPVLNKLSRDITAAGGIDALLERIADGEPMIQVARSFDVTRWTLTHWIDRQPEGTDRLRAARRAGAASLAEDGLRIADAATHDNDRAARLQIDQRRWLAGKFDPETFGDQQQPLVQINLNDMHLTALRTMEGRGRDNTLPLIPDSHARHDAQLGSGQQAQQAGQEQANTGRTDEPSAIEPST